MTAMRDIDQLTKFVVYSLSNLLLNLRDIEFDEVVMAAVYGDSLTVAYRRGAEIFESWFSIEDVRNGLSIMQTDYDEWVDEHEETLKRVANSENN